MLEVTDQSYTYTGNIRVNYTGMYLHCMPVYLGYNPMTQDTDQVHVGADLYVDGQIHYTNDAVPQLTGSWGNAFSGSGKPAQNVNVTLIGIIVFVCARINSTLGTVDNAVDSAQYDQVIPAGLRPPATIAGFAALEEAQAKNARIVVSTAGQISISKFDLSNFILGESVAIHPWTISYHL